MWMAGGCGLERAGIANVRLYFPIHNVKQRCTLWSMIPKSGHRFSDKIMLKLKF
jgi:hypothetical protein